MMIDGNVFGNECLNSKGLSTLNAELKEKVEELEGELEEKTEGDDFWSPRFQKSIEDNWSRRHGLRYTRVKVLLVSWDLDDLGVTKEIDKLADVFSTSYCFQVSKFQIPEQNPTRALQHRVGMFVGDDDPETLLISYYAGHGSRSSLTRSLLWSPLVLEYQIFGFEFTANSYTEQHTAIPVFHQPLYSRYLKRVDLTHFFCMMHAPRQTWEAAMSVHLSGVSQHLYLHVELQTLHRA